VEHPGAHNAGTSARPDPYASDRRMLDTPLFATSIYTILIQDNKMFGYSYILLSYSIWSGDVCPEDRLGIQLAVVKRVV